MTSRNGNSVTWTSYNFPQTINGTGESTTFDYGPNHQYWRQTYNGPSGSETTYYLNKLVEKVDTATGSDWRHYIFGPSGVVAIYSRQSSGTNAVHYMLSDHQESVASLLTSTGASYVNESFAPFGARRNPVTWSGAPTTGDQNLINAVTRVGYTGQQMLGNMGLIHMNGRVQDSTLGRFLSADPYVVDPSNTQSFNRYSYVLNNPLSYIDPSGFDCDKNSGQTCAPNPNGTCPDGTSPVRDQSGQVIYCTVDEEVVVTGSRGHPPPSSPGGVVYYVPVNDQSGDPGSQTGGGAQTDNPCPKISAWPKSVGYGAGGHAFAGMGGRGAAASGSASKMWFFSDGHSAVTLSGGAVLGSPGSSTTVPRGPEPSIYGAGLGVGPFVEISNASGQSQLQGPFHTLDINAIAIDIQVSWAGGIWQVSIGQASPGLGVAKYDTITGVQSGGCHSP